MLTSAWIIVMTWVMEHSDDKLVVYFDDSGMEHCDGNGIGHCDEKGMEPVHDRVQGAF